MEILESDAKKGDKLFSICTTRADIHIYIRNDRTLINGSAQIFPRNIIQLYPYPPTGVQYLVDRQDWIHNLVIHELVHIVHLDRAEGFNRVLTVLFGTFGKIFVMISPRWFLEGVATWAETDLTQGGRGRNRLLNYEIDRILLGPDSCSSIDCLDDPGVYPYGSTSYWVGQKFLTFLENQREGTMRCMVSAMSGSLFRTLNYAFRICAGQDASSAF